MNCIYFDPLCYFLCKISEYQIQEVEDNELVLYKLPLAGKLEPEEVPDVPKVSTVYYRNLI